MTKRAKAKAKRQPASAPSVETKGPVSITVVADATSGRKMMALQIGKTTALVTGSVQIGSMTCSLGGGR